MAWAGAWVKGPPGSLSVEACGGRILRQVAVAGGAAAQTSGPPKAVLSRHLYWEGLTLCQDCSGPCGELKARQHALPSTPACVQDWPLWKALVCPPSPGPGRLRGSLAVQAGSHWEGSRGNPLPRNGRLLRLLMGPGPTTRGQGSAGAAPWELGICTTRGAAGKGCGHSLSPPSPCSSPWAR